MEDHFGKRVNRSHLKQIADDGGPTESCMEGWFFGKTKRPQNATLEAAGRAIGYERRWVKSEPKAEASPKLRVVGGGK